MLSAWFGVVKPVESPSYRSVGCISSARTVVLRVPGPHQPLRSSTSTVASSFNPPIARRAWNSSREVYLKPRAQDPSSGLSGADSGTLLSTRRWNILQILRQPEQAVVVLLVRLTDGVSHDGSLSDVSVVASPVVGCERSLVAPNDARTHRASCSSRNAQRAGREIDQTVTQSKTLVSARRSHTGDAATRTADAAA